MNGSAAICKAIVRVFESGRARGRYDALVANKADKGGLSYGVCQFTRASGSLWELVREYRDRRGRYAGQLLEWSTAFLKRSIALDTDLRLHALLRQAAEDPVMRAAQEALFDRRYWQPTCAAAKKIGLVEPLSMAAMLDSGVQGSRDYIQGKTEAYAGRCAVAGERAWIVAYLQKRREWLYACGGLLRRSVYRVDNLAALAAAGLWALPLPLLLPERRVTIHLDDIQG